MASLRDNKPIALERWNKGERIRASKLNQAVDAVNRLKAGVAAPAQIRKRRGGEAEAAGVALIRLEFVRHEWDALVCVDPNAEEQVEIMVAKPFLLRPLQNPARGDIPYTYDLFPWEREADIGSIREVQRVVPEYLTGDRVVAVSATADIIGKVQNRPVADGGPVDLDVSMIEINQGGRAWAAVLREVRIQ